MLTDLNRRNCKLTLKEMQAELSCLLSLTTLQRVFSKIRQRYTFSCDSSLNAWQAEFQPLPAHVSLSREDTEHSQVQWLANRETPLKGSIKCCIMFHYRINSNPQPPSPAIPPTCPQHLFCLHRPLRLQPPIENWLFFLEEEDAASVF